VALTPQDSRYVRIQQSALTGRQLSRGKRDPDRKPDRSAPVIACMTWNRLRAGVFGLFGIKGTFNRRCPPDERVTHYRERRVSSGPGG